MPPSWPCGSCEFDDTNFFLKDACLRWTGAGRSLRQRCSQQHPSFQQGCKTCDAVTCSNLSSRCRISFGTWLQNSMEMLHRKIQTPPCLILLVATCNTKWSLPHSRILAPCRCSRSISWRSYLGKNINSSTLLLLRGPATCQDRRPPPSVTIGHCHPGCQQNMLAKIIPLEISSMLDNMEGKFGTTSYLCVGPASPNTRNFFRASSATKKKSRKPGPGTRNLDGAGSA